MTPEMQEFLDKREAPHVTKADIAKRVASHQYTMNGLMTICVIELDNGFKVVGTSNCVSPANFNAQIGETMAYNNAFDKLWDLFGFLLREDFYRAKVQDNEFNLLSAMGDHSGE